MTRKAVWGPARYRAMTALRMAHLLTASRPLCARVAVPFPFWQGRRHLVCNPCALSVLWTKASWRRKHRLVWLLSGAATCETSCCKVTACMQLEALAGGRKGRLDGLYWTVMSNGGSMLMRMAVARVWAMYPKPIPHIQAYSLRLHSHNCCRQSCRHTHWCGAWYLLWRVRRAWGVRGSRGWEWLAPARQLHLAHHMTWPQA